MLASKRIPLRLGNFKAQCLAALVLAIVALLPGASTANAQEPDGDAQPAPAAAEAPARPDNAVQAAPRNANELLTLGRFLIFEGGAIGYVIIALSVALVALMFQQLIGVRRGRLMPWGLAEELHKQISAGNYRHAEELCKQHRSYLSHVVGAGLVETQLGYTAVEKAMEDASQQHAARLFRQLEYFTVIGTIAPMLGLLGTVWGMIEAFMEFERKVNPAVSELAPGIYKALVTTFQGLVVAIPALALYAIFRNRTDELVAQTTLLAEHVFAGFKRAGALRRLEARRARPADKPKPPEPGTV